MTTNIPKHVGLFGRNIKAVLWIATLVSMGLLLDGPLRAQPYQQCVPVGHSPSCGILIVVNADNTVSKYTDTNVFPYDLGFFGDDTLIGVQNNSSKTVYALQITSGLASFAFSADGICSSIVPDPHPTGCGSTGFGPTGYEGPGISFSGVPISKAACGYSFNGPWMCANDPNANTGTVNFTGGLAPHGSAYFGLDKKLTDADLTISNVNFTPPATPSISGGTTTDTLPTVCTPPPTPVTSFPPTASKVYLFFAASGLSQTDALSDKWLAPQGSQYASHSWTPGSQSACFSDSIAIANNPPASMPGIWTIQILLNNQVVGTVQFTITNPNSQPTVETIVTTPSVAPITTTCPATPSAVSNFSTTSTAAYVYFILDNLATGDVVAVVWLDPTGKPYAAAGSSWTLTSGGNYCFESKLNIAGQTPATMPGNWSIKILDNQNTITTVYFTITVPSTTQLTPSITQVDTTKCPTITPSVSVANSAGSPVSGLTASNFTLLEDGQTRAITVLQIGSGTLASYQITYVTVDRTLDHSVTITVTQAGSTGTVTQLVSGCCPVSVTSNPGSGPDTIPPFGSFDTPVNNTAGVVGAVAVTGWALDNVGVTKVEIYRDPIGTEPKGNFGLVFIGTASLVKGARPDVQAAYPTYPYSDRAGWGYMLLTNFLPNTNGSPGLGNGTFRLHAIAYDAASNTAELGAPGKVITTDNAHAAKPFGTIDTPGQGAVASGTQYINFGWALTPGSTIKIPTDGSTITVLIDGQAIGHPNYNQYRNDIATLFPGYTNTPGPVGFFSVDTTQFPGCTHTIAWLVFDNGGRGEGIGSRFFTIEAAPASNTTEPLREQSEDGAVTLRRTADAGASAEILRPGDDGAYALEVEELGYIELDAGAIAGYVEVGEERQNLPVGSSLKRGVFYWQLGPVFVGEYRIVLLRPSGEQIPVRIRVRPKTYPGSVR